MKATPVSVSEPVEQRKQAQHDVNHTNESNPVADPVPQNQRDVKQSKGDAQKAGESEIPPVPKTLNPQNEGELMTTEVNTEKGRKAKKEKTCEEGKQE